MQSALIRFAIAAGLAGITLQAHSSDLHIQLQGNDPLSHKTASFTCDQNAAKLGLPSGVFQVEYINGAGNSLAVLPIAGKSLIFASTMSASGARYAADRFTWSDGGTRGSFLWSDSLAGHMQTLCHAAN